MLKEQQKISEAKYEIADKFEEFNENMYYTYDKSLVESHLLKETEEMLDKKRIKRSNNETRPASR